VRNFVAGKKFNAQYTTILTTLKTIHGPQYVINCFHPLWANTNLSNPKLGEQN